MRRLLFTPVLLFAMFIAANSAARAQSTQLSQQAVRDIAVNAYLYFYPIVTMDITRSQLTNVAAASPETGQGPVNMFINLPAYPPANLKTVVRPNFDTLYSTAWVDLTREPVVVSAPDTKGRYYLLPMLDMWTDVFASPGWRTTGTQAQNLVLVPPQWTGSLPSGLTRIDAPTPMVWIIGRTQTNGPADYPAVHAVQAGYKLTPLSQWGKPATGSAAQPVDPNIDMKTPPKTQVDTMSGEKFFTYAAELLKAYPPHRTDQPILAQLERIGVVPGKSLTFSALDPQVQEALNAAPAQAQKLMAAFMPKMAPIVNGWQMNTNTMGVYGTFYLKRAIVAQFGLGANLPEDAIYPANVTDNNGKPLDGSHRYKIHFAKGQYPPAQAFWSVTLYDDQGFQVANPLNRFALSSWMPLQKNADGSLDLYVQHGNPGKANEANWLPAPSGPFTLTMRIYAPASAALNGQWAPPSVQKL